MLGHGFWLIVFFLTSKLEKEAEGNDSINKFE